MEIKTQKKCAEESFVQSLVSAPGTGTVRANLLRILRSVDLVGWSHREESGRLDRRGFVRFSTGDANIFSRREVKEADKAAVEVLIDCSGSMTGKIETAQDVAITLGNILDKARVQFSVDGFTTGGSGLSIVQFKRWGESLRQAKAKLGSINLCSLAGTPDYLGLHYGLEQLVRRPESRKVLFVLTDAEGYSQTEMKQINKIAESFGITIVAIGIGRTGVKKFFKFAANVRDVKELGGVAFNTLLKAVA